MYTGAFPFLYFLSNKTPDLLIPWSLCLIGNVDLIIHACKLSLRDPKHVGTSWTNFPKSVFVLHFSCTHGTYTQKLYTSEQVIRIYRRLLKDNLWVVRTHCYTSQGSLFKPRVVINPHFLVQVQCRNAFSRKNGSKSYICNTEVYSSVVLYFQQLLHTPVF